MCSNNDAVKCGGIIIDSYRQNILCVLNRMSYLKGENKWGFPKGHRNKDEISWKCAQREIMEETSLFLEKRRFNRPLKIYNNIYYIIPLTEKYSELLSKDTNEIYKVEWKTLEELRQSNHNRDLKMFVDFIHNRPLSLLLQIYPTFKNNYKHTYQNKTPNKQEIKTLSKYNKQENLIISK